MLSRLGSFIDTDLRNSVIVDNENLDALSFKWERGAIDDWEVLNIVNQLP